MINHGLRELSLRWVWFVFLGLLSTPHSIKAAVQDSHNREVLSKAVEALVSAWNKRDAEVISRLFLPDAVLVMPTGKIARTRAAIRERLLDEWSGKLKDTVLTHAVESVSLNNDGTAVVKGKYRLEGVKVLVFENAPEGTFIFNHKRVQGRWMIAKAELLRNMRN
jgi:uncharacterized protein (TIGR02246 family)